MQGMDQAAKQEQKFLTMTTQPVKGLIVRLAIPTMISMMITSVYNMADTFFVGHLPGDTASVTAATAAVGVAYPLMAAIRSAFAVSCLPKAREI